MTNPLCLQLFKSNQIKFTVWFLPQAIDYYLRAMKSLACRESHPAVWDSVNWELSTTYFTLATLLQDYAPLSRKAQEQVSFSTCCSDFYILKKLTLYKFRRVMVTVYVFFFFLHQ